MTGGRGCRRLVLAAFAMCAVILCVGAGSALGLTLRGRAPNNTVVVRASGVASGTYTIDGGQRVRFSHIRSLRIDGVGGHDVCRIVNPPGGLFAPPGGIACNGGNRPGAPRRGVLEVSGGRAASSAYSPSRGRPGAGTMTARLGRLVQVIRFTGLKPAADTAPSASFTFNDSSPNDVVEVVDGSGAGQMRIQSSTGQFESITIANKQAVTVNANTGGDSATIDVEQAVAGLGSLAVNAVGSVSVKEALLTGAALTLHSTGGEVNQDEFDGPIVLGTGPLAASAAGKVQFNVENTVGSFSASAAGGDVEFHDVSVQPLSVGSVTAAGSVALSSSKGLDLGGTVSGANSGNIFLITFGPLLMAPSSSVNGGSMKLEAPSMTLAPGSVNSSGTVTLQPAFTGETIQLGSDVTGDFGLLQSDIAAITAPGGLLIGGDSGTGPIVVTEPISWTQGGGGLALETPAGFTRDSAGTLSAPTLTLVNNGSTARHWAITPASVADGSGFSIPYTAGTLQVGGGSGGDTLNVTPSPNTSYTVDGGPSANGILDYHPVAATVSGSLSPPSGEIDATGVKPVKFSGMASVNGLPTAGLTVTVHGHGTVTATGGIRCPGTCTHSYLAGTTVQLTATPTNGSTFTGWSGACSGKTTCSLTLNSGQSVGATFATPAPRCVLTAPSSAVSHPPTPHSRKRHSAPTTLALRVTCDQAAKVRLTGTIAEQLHPRTGHGKVKTKTVRTPLTVASVSAKITKTVALTLSSAAANALVAGVHESASIALTATNSNGTTTTTLRLGRLRP